MLGSANLGPSVFFSIVTITLSKVVRLSPNFECKFPRTKVTDVANFLTVSCLVAVFLDLAFHVQFDHNVFSEHNFCSWTAVFTVTYFKYTHKLISDSLNNRSMV